MNNSETDPIPTPSEQVGAFPKIVYSPLYDRPDSNHAVIADLSNVKIALQNANVPEKTISELTLFISPSARKKVTLGQYQQFDQNDPPPNITIYTKPHLPKNKIHSPRTRIKEFFYISPNQVPTQSITSTNTDHRSCLKVSENLQHTFNHEAAHAADFNNDETKSNSLKAANNLKRARQVLAYTKAALVLTNIIQTDTHPKSLAKTALKIKGILFAHSLLEEYIYLKSSHEISARTYASSQTFDPKTAIFTLIPKEVQQRGIINRLQQAVTDKVQQIKLKRVNSDMIT